MERTINISSHGECIDTYTAAISKKDKSIGITNNMFTNVFLEGLMLDRGENKFGRDEDF